MKRISKRIYASVSILLVLAMVLGVIHFNKVSAAADGYVTLPGIETIVLNNSPGNPFIIVEVVANKSDASLGYLIKGEEPLKDGKALHDMPSFDERNMALKDFVDYSSSDAKVSSLLGAGAISVPAGDYEEFNTPGDGIVTDEAHGYFMQDSATGDYKLRIPKNAFRLYVPETDAGKNRYTHYLDVDFTGSRDVALTFKFLNNAADKRMTYHGENYAMYYVYSVEKKVTLDTVGLNLADYVGEPVFQIITDVNGFESYVYYGTMQDSVNIVTVDGSIENTESMLKDRYAFVTFEKTTLGGNYVYSDVVDVSDNNGGFGLYSHYEVNNTSGDYVRDESLKDTYIYMPAYDPYVEDEENFEYFGPYSYVATDFTEASGTEFYYKNGLGNADWFRDYVMDIPKEELASFNIDVKTMTIEEFNAYDVTRANMVYFAGGSYTDDINPSQAQNVISEIVNNKLPVVMDRSFGSGLPNNDKLSVLLLQEDMNISAVSAVISDQWENADQWAKLKNSVKATSSFVNRSVYVYDDNAAPFIYGDFISPFSDITGFDAVKSEVDTENEYRKVKLGNSTPLVRDTVSKATALRYIINYSNQRITTKTSVKVLEIEPCYSFTTYYSVGTGKDNDLKKVHVPYHYDTNGNKHTDNNNLTVANLTQETLTEDKVKSWINQNNVNTGTNVDLVQTYTKEFIGKVEDLNENYDLIYIGLDTTTMNTKVENVTYRYNNVVSGTGTKTNQTIYYDSAMNGLIYSHYGDLVKSGNNKQLWWQEGFVDKFKANGNTDYYRMSGNDITQEKYNDLVEYIKTGYAVVFADKYFNVTTASDGSRTATVNTSVVAKDSYMYKLGEFAAKCLNVNVFLQSDLETTKNSAVLERFKTWLNISKLHVSPKQVPTEYSNTTGGNPVYLNSDSLTYAVELKNDAAIGVTSTTYDVHLYIDISVDGRYTDDEEISNLSVYEGSISEATKLKTTAEGHYALYAGRTYYIQRTLPAGYVGMLPWKLVFTQNGNPTVRRALTGYTALPISSSQRETIKVLQIIGEWGSFGNNLDLTNDLVKKQLDMVQDFDIQISKITANKLIDNNGPSEADYLSYYNNYDMLILGFSDVFDFTGTKSKSGTKAKNEAAAKALAAYIQSGRSVLFTHDTTSIFNYDYDNSSYQRSPYYEGSYKWGYYFNKYVRSVVGMDRYNVLGGSEKYDYFAKDGDTTTDNAKSKKELLTHGYTDSELGLFLGNSGYYQTSRQTAASDHGNQGQYHGEQYYVTKVNDGQITEYPFKIPDRLAIELTHYQYYQLNLDTDSKDSINNDDIVVWYCLSDVGSKGSNAETAATRDDIYQMNPNDVRNNYYIYNKGNITYSGVGHSSLNLDATKDISELRLFINTMVAAYKAGVHPPKVVYHDGDSHAPINTAYVPYDHVLKKYLDDEVVLYFEITDSSFVQGVRQLEHEFKIVRYNADGTKKTPENVSAAIYEVKADGTLGAQKTGELDFDTTYALKLKTADLQFTGDDVMPYVSICVRAQTKYKTEGSIIESGWGEYNLDIRRTELFDLK